MRITRHPLGVGFFVVRHEHDDGTVSCNLAADNPTLFGRGSNEEEAVGHLSRQLDQLAEILRTRRFDYVQEPAITRRPPDVPFRPERICIEPPAEPSPDWVIDNIEGVVQHLNGTLETITDKSIVPFDRNTRKP